MRAVVQRVSSASVQVAGQDVARIGQGLLVLLGIERGDSAHDTDYVCGKVRDLRIFNDERGKLNCSIGDVDGQILVVSQFTLAGDCRHGRRPSFDGAAPPDQARPIYESFVKALEQTGVPVQTGAFQAMMQVELVNDGPVTVLLDSRRGF